MCAPVDLPFLFDVFVTFTLPSVCVHFVIDLPPWLTHLSLHCEVYCFVEIKGTSSQASNMTARVSPLNCSPPCEESPGSPPVSNQLSDNFGPPKHLNCLQRFAERLVPDGGTLSGVFNLAAGSLGAGILGLPTAFRDSGVVAGTIYLIIIYLFTVLSMNLLARTAVKTGIHSYEKTGARILGRGGDVFVAVVMFGKCFGACIAYVISVSDLISAFLTDDSVTGYWRTKSWNRILTSIFFLIFMLPLSLPKRINSLRHVSMFAVVFLLYFVITVVIHCSMYGFENGVREDLYLVRGGNDGIQGLGVLMFAYLCQSNMYEVWNEMKPRRNVSQMTMETAISMFICTVLLWFTGFFGYAEFGPDVTSSILRMYKPLHDVMMFIAYVGVLVKLCVAFALHILPCRDSIHHLLGWSLDEVAWWKNAALCTILSVIALIAGLFIPNINIVLSLLGSLTGSFIAFVFPAIYLMYAGGFSYAKSGFFIYTSTYALLFAGIVVIGFGTTSTIYHIIV
ncbi:amino acid permease [Trypanosoma rangeli]|uniref:Amino acid permease n=1 Tax=Trypanosoma rangeli TaxID=5698 RepID=A0A3R7RFB5_TRYRA|nr:amino acid permease [Trypanosoma rangeli]RNF01571.1 amino acid permease [Trypanosoma rangeli]|eukprot:RNF01571.1 amino acid permease [Trypanosoma rangeli]